MTSRNPTRDDELHGGERSSWQRNVSSISCFVVLFAVFFFYLLMRICPELFYQQNPAIFQCDSRFFTTFLEEPGGFVEYISAFLSPLLAIGWLGALILTILVALICLATRQIISATEGKGGQVVYLLPAVMILMVLDRYIHPVKLCVGLLVALPLAIAYFQMAGRRVAVRIALFVIASVVVYFLSAGMYVVFACLCGLFEMGIKRQRILGALYLICGAVLPFTAGTWLFDLNMREAYDGLLLANWEHWLATPSSVSVSMSVQTGLLLFFPVATVGMAWCRNSLNRRWDTAQLRELTSEDRRPEWVSWTVPIVAFVFLGLVVDATLFDSKRKCLLELAGSAEQQRWADVLDHAQRLASTGGATDPRTVVDVNRALHFRGDLLDQMFRYPQGLSSPTLALIYERPTKMATLWPRQCSEVLFELGRINESEHMGYEALETFGDRPRLLKRLVYIHVLKGEPDVARRFLSLMERSLLHRRWARDCQRQLAADSTLSGIPTVASLRESMVTTDSLNEVTELEKMLLGLLDRNPRNRMAVEYLLAHYLLNRKLDEFVANLHRLDDAGYQRLPQHCEEALVIYLATIGSEELEFEGHVTRAETWLRFGRFMRTIRQSPDGTSDAAIAKSLYTGFNDSYFFCYYFGHNRPTE